MTYKLGDTVRVRSGMLRGKIGKVEQTLDPAFQDAAAWPLIRIPGEIPPTWRVHPDELERVAIIPPDGKWHELPDGARSASADTFMVELDFLPNGRARVVNRGEAPVVVAYEIAP